MSRKLSRTAAGVLLGALYCFASSQSAPAATLFLKAGEFFGPGITGVHPFNNAFVTNLQFTGPLQGVVPFFNNGANPPLVLAQELFGGPQTGFTSDGRAINKNANTGLFLDLTDPDSGESARMMVISYKADEFGPDSKGNLAFHAHVAADPGLASEVVPFEVLFTTGTVIIPTALRTQMGLPGGHDTAGPLPAGRALVGRIGDFDHDGFMDGELVIGQNSPLNLVVARGDPIAQRRPWISDIPVTRLQSATLNLNGIVQNFPPLVVQALSGQHTQTVIDDIFDVTTRLNAALYDVTELIVASSSSEAVRERARRVRLLLLEGREHLEHAVRQVGRRDDDGDERGEAIESVQHGFSNLGKALLELNALASRS